MPLAVVDDLPGVAPQVGRKLLGRRMQPPELAPSLCRLGSVLLRILPSALGVVGQFLRGIDGLAGVTVPEQALDLL